MSVVVVSLILIVILSEMVIFQEKQSFPTQLESPRSLPESTVGGKKTVVFNDQFAISSSMPEGHSSERSQLLSLNDTSPDQDAESSESRVVKPPEVPLAFEQGEIMKKLASEHPAIVHFIAEEFSSNITSSGISPYDTRYLDLWNDAVKKANESFSQEFGADALQSLYDNRSMTNQ